ncbi:MAG: TauD/TfdA family dioxygenase [Alphaproteobacteria bacterium]|nr:TauD/TfdA family dioxygenase [Alphaproteobacteria bacterium]
MSEMRMEPVTGPSVWTGAELENDSSWQVTLGEAERAALLAGMKTVQSKGLWLHQMRAEDFPLDDALKGLVARIRSDVRDGRGFVVLHGFPLEELSIDEIRLAYWGLSLQLGTCVSQDSRAALVADVWDRGQKPSPLVRAYGSRYKAGLHVDLADVVGLLCVRQADSDPWTTLGSSGAVYNAFLKEHAELLPMLYEGFPWDRRGESRPDENPITEMSIPIFSYADGQLSCRYNRAWILGAFARQKRELTNAETVLFDFFDEAAERTQIAFPLRPGDLYFASNYTVLHGRAGYDAEAPDLSQKRHLLRVWLNMPGMRRFADPASTRYGLLQHGNLGWTGAELLARKHLEPMARRDFLDEAFA